MDLLFSIFKRVFQLVLLSTLYWKKRSIHKLIYCHRRNTSMEVYVTNFILQIPLGATSFCKHTNIIHLYFVSSAKHIYLCECNKVAQFHFIIKPLYRLYLIATPITVYGTNLVLIVPYQVSSYGNIYLHYSKCVLLVSYGFGSCNNN